MENESADFISLSEATTYCDHSQDYLNLLARKGMLRAVKIGRNWVTTKEWLSEYQQRIERKRMRMAEKAYGCPEAVGQNSVEAEIFAVDNAAKETEKRTDGIAENFPVLQHSSPAAGIVNEQPKSETLKKNYLSGIFASNRLRVAGVLAIFLALFCGAALVGPSAGFKAFSNFENSVAQSQEAKNILNVSGRASALITDGWDVAARSLFGTATFLKKEGYGFLDYLFNGRTEVVKVTRIVPGANSVVFQKSVDVLEENIIDDTQGRFDQFREEFDLPGDVAKAGTADPERGMVVIPAGGDSEQAREKIEQSFSDEVTVNPKDEVSGIIVPRFKDKEGEDYVYMIVPVDKE